MPEYVYICVCDAAATDVWNKNYDTTSHGY